MNTDNPREHTVRHSATATTPMASQAEVESLNRQVSSLSFQLARVISEHGHELNKKDKLRDEIVFKRDLRYKKNEKLLAGMQSERASLKRSLESATTQLEAKKHTALSLQQEVATLCGKLETATARIKDLEKQVAMKTRPVSGARHPARRAKTTPLAGQARLKKFIRMIEHAPPAHAPERTNVVTSPTSPTNQTTQTNPSVDEPNQSPTARDPTSPAIRG